MSAPGSVGVLLLEDSALDAELTIGILAREFPGVTVTRVDHRAGFEAALLEPGFDVILADFSLPGFTGVDALAIARARAPDVPFIFVSGALGEEIAIDSLRHGATDYVLKHRLARLPGAVRRALAETRARREQREGEAHLHLMVAELSHRVKNTLATVQSIAHQTLLGTSDMAQFEDRFLGRLMALSDAHGLLFANDWRNSGLKEIVGRSLRPYSALDETTAPSDLIRLPVSPRGACGPSCGPAFGKVRIEGPDVQLGPRKTLALSLVFHELAANAARFGALSSSDGVVHVTWTIGGQADAPRTELLWQEEGGPEVASPTHRGFGQTLLERSLRHELDGEGQLEFTPAGIRARLAFPLG